MQIENIELPKYKTNHVVSFYLKFFF